jgi:hypothetical protein
LRVYHSATTARDAAAGSRANGLPSDRPGNSKSTHG